MLRLIINADDLGLTPGCNRGILRALTEGIVSDTTLLINTDYTQDAVDLLRRQGLSRCGLHLNLTWGSPVLPVAQAASLTDKSGRFRRKAEEALAEADPRQIEAELRAQAAKFRSTGLTLTHLDSHHHVHTYPQVIDIAIGLAGELGVPLRQKDNVRQRIVAGGVATTDRFSADFYGPGVAEENLRRIILDRAGGTLEIMCHPAEPDPLLAEISSYNQPRMRELAILTAPEMKEFLRDNGVELIGFADLQG